MPNTDIKTTILATAGKAATKRSIFAQLMKAYPVLSQPKPLQIGIEQVLCARSDLSSGRIKKGLRYYMRTTSYLLEVAKGGPRYDLDGNPAGTVTADQQQQAQATLAQRKAALQVRKNAQQRQPKVRADADTWSSSKRINETQPALQHDR